MPRGSLQLLFFAGAAIALAAACGTSAVGVDACREIETARCQQAGKLDCPGVSLATPVSNDDNKVDACVRYYRDACLHGLSNPNDPGGVAVAACVSAINGGGCDLVIAPESAPACAFLIPPGTIVTTDAGVDAGDGDATVVDAGSDADAGD